jgi:hypothetical protein
MATCSYLSLKGLSPTPFALSGAECRVRYEPPIEDPGAITCRLVRPAARLTNIVDSD